MADPYAYSVATMARSSSRRARRSTTSFADGSVMRAPRCSAPAVSSAPMDFAARYGPWAVVAGASEGVGSAVARLLGERGVNVVLVSRRQAVLEEVAATVKTETRTVALDLSLPDADIRLAESTDDLDVGLLIYNAGADPYQSKFLDQPL